MSKLLMSQICTTPEFLKSMLSWWEMCLANPEASISIILVLGCFGLAFYRMQTKRLLALKKIKR